MSRSVYHLDCPSGLAGDMFLGACLDLGLPLERLEAALEGLQRGSGASDGQGWADLQAVRLEARRARRGGVEGVRFRVLRGGEPLEGPDPEEGASLPPGPAPPEAAEGKRRAAHTGRARTWRDIRALLERADLEQAVKERSIDWFARLAEVEARVHGTEPDDVHFHEVGAIDSIVDIVGAAAAVEWMAPARVTCGPVVVGRGTVQTQHGRLPIPAPATARLLARASIRPGPLGELVTPTGALVLDRLVDAYNDGPTMVVGDHGYGLGRWDLAEQPNVVRLWRGTSSSSSGERGLRRGVVAVLESQVDDLSGEAIGYVFERLLEAGALDVFLTPVQMKKGRPGVLVSVLCDPTDADRLAGLLVLESGSLGCRYRLSERLEAPRSLVEVATEYGTVRVKVAWLGSEGPAGAPEYDDCRRLALEAGVPWRDVHRAALIAFDTEDLPESGP